jgi:hypothetical protein
LIYKGKGMAGLAGFEPAPPPLVVGSIESNGKKVGKSG